MSTLSDILQKATFGALTGGTSIGSELGGLMASRLTGRSPLDPLPNAIEATAIPGQYLRGALAWQPGARMSGREMLEAQGALGPNTPGLDWGDAAGLGADVVADPLNLIPIGALSKWAGMGRQARLAEKIAAPAMSRVAPEIASAIGREGPASASIMGKPVALENAFEKAYPQGLMTDYVSPPPLTGSGKHFTDELPIPNGPRFVRDPIEGGGAAYDVWHGDKQVGLVEVHDDYNLDQGSKRLFKDIVKPEEKVVRLQNIGLEDGAGGDAFRKTGVGREMWRKAFGEAGDNWLGNSQLGFQGGDTTAVDSLQKLADRGFVELHWGRYGPGSNFVAKLTPKGKQWVAGEVDVPRMATPLAAELTPRRLPARPMSALDLDAMRSAEAAKYGNADDIGKWLGSSARYDWLRHPDRLKGVVPPELRLDLDTAAKLFADAYHIPPSEAAMYLRGHVTETFQNAGVGHAKTLREQFRPSETNPEELNIFNPNTGIPRFQSGDRALDDIRQVTASPDSFLEMGHTSGGGSYDAGIPFQKYGEHVKHVTDQGSQISRPERIRDRIARIGREYYNPEWVRKTGIHETDHFLNDYDNISPELLRYLSQEVDAANLLRTGRPGAVQDYLPQLSGVAEPTHQYLSKPSEILARLEELRDDIVKLPGGSRYGGLPVIEGTGTSDIPMALNQQILSETGVDTLKSMRRMFPDSVIQRLLQNVPVVAGAAAIPTAAAAYGGNLSQQY